MLATTATDDQHRAIHPGTLAHPAARFPLGPTTLSRTMVNPPQRPSRADREAQRALLEEALSQLPTASDPDRAAAEVMRALDSYIESTGGGTALTPREAPVTDYARQEERETRWAMWLVLGGAALSTAVVAVVLSGGWPALIAIVAIWVIALAALVST